MGCYYLTAGRGGRGEAVEAGDRHDVPQPGRGRSWPTALKAEVGRLHAEDRRSALAASSTEGHQRGPDASKDKTVARSCRASRTGWSSTTVGRVIFNDILHPKMAFYDLPLDSKHLSRIIADCYQLLGRRENDRRCWTA